MNHTCYALTSKAKTPLALNCQLRLVVDELVHAAYSSVFDTITVSTFKIARFVLAPPEILAEFETMAAPLFKRILAASEESRTLAARRDPLLPKLISGALRVKDAEKLVEAVA